MAYRSAKTEVNVNQEAIHQESQREICAILAHIYSADVLPALKFTSVAGLTDAGWHVTDGEHHWLARGMTVEKRQLGISATREANILKHLSAYGLAPNPLIRQGKWLVLEWVVGETMSEQLFMMPEHQQTLSTLLVSLHDKPLSGYPLNIRQRLAHQLMFIDRRRFTPCWLKLHQSMMRTPLPVSIKTALVHMDLHEENIILTMPSDRPTLRLIDWEYAADADIALELAALFQGNGWTSEEQKTFLDYYCQRGGYHDVTRLAQAIAQWIPWVTYLSMLWFELRWRQSGDEHYLEASSEQRRYLGLSH